MSAESSGDFEYGVIPGRIEVTEKVVVSTALRDNPDLSEGGVDSVERDLKHQAEALLGMLEGFSYRLEERLSAIEARISALREANQNIGKSV